MPALPPVRMHTVLLVVQLAAKKKPIGHTAYFHRIMGVKFE